MKTLYVFGNAYLQDDRFAQEVASLVDGCHICHCSSPDELLDASGDEILILDVVKGISSPVLIDNVSQIKTRNLVSLHDFDVGFFLNMWEAIGEQKSIKIIGVPMSGDAQSIASQIKGWLA